MSNLESRRISNSVGRISKLKSRISNRICLLLALAALTGCARLRGGDPQQPPTVTHVDLQRYTGTWYEIARLPNWFERGLSGAVAVYAPRPDGSLSVANTGLKPDGTSETARGRAWVVDPPTNSKLKVRFDNWFSRLFPGLTTGDYWILALDDEYQKAIVGTPDRKYLWFLARQPRLTDGEYAALLARATELGYPTAKMIRNSAAPPVPSAEP